MVQNSKIYLLTGGYNRKPSISITFNSYVYTIFMYDHGNELLGHEFKQNIIKNKNNPDCATTSNTQENYILEKIHQVIENIVHTFDLKKYLD